MIPEEPETKKRKTLAALLQDTFSDDEDTDPAAVQKSPEYVAEQEVERYLAEGKLSAEDDPLL